LASRVSPLCVVPIPRLRDRNDIRPGGGATIRG
jgi:hypothetical protein